GRAIDKGGSVHQPEQAPDPATSLPVADPSISAVPVAGRPRRTVLIVGVIAAVVLLAAGGVAVVPLRPTGSAGCSHPSPRSGSNAASPRPTTVTPTVPKYAGALPVLAIPMPSGATRESLRMGTADGSLDLDAVLDEYDESSRASLRDTLTNLEFERGVFLAWT